MKEGRLVYRSRGEERVKLLGEEPAVIGRDPVAEVRLDSPYVSRRHARVERDGEAFVIVELGSANPTYVNGTAVTGRQVLHPGDTIRVADVDLVFNEEIFDPDATVLISPGTQASTAPLVAAAPAAPGPGAAAPASAPRRPPGGPAARPAPTSPEPVAVAPAPVAVAPAASVPDTGAAPVASAAAEEAAVEATRNPADEAMDHARRELGDTRGLGNLRGTLTIMFTDLESSTKLGQELGDQRWQGLLRLHNQALRAEIARHGGHEVKTAGDGFMVVFEGASQGIRCAVAIQGRMRELGAQHSEAPLRVRIGLNLGEVISEESDFFGTAVVLAARIMAKAAGEQIYISNVLQQIVAPTGEFTIEAKGAVRLKGFQRTHRIYEVAYTE